jgi:hypothetical protein
MLGGSQPTGGSAATVGVILALLYLFRGLLVGPTGTHAKQRGTNRLHRD